MNSKPVLMIHEVTEDILALPLENYVLTFDDGLYSQYYYIEHFNKLDTEKIFFISSSIVCAGAQSLDFPNCVQAHEKAFAGDMSDYMTVEQIKTLTTMPKVSVGGHSHSHTSLDKFSTLAEKANYLKQDTEQMISWFETTLGFKPTKFCYPYNNNLEGIYKALLMKHGVTEFYGSERIPVEMLLRS